MTKTIDAIYERGMLRPQGKLPLREHAKVTLIIRPDDPVSRTRGLFRVSKRAATILIYDNSLLDE